MDHREKAKCAICGNSITQYDDRWLHVRDLSRVALDKHQFGLDAQGVTSMIAAYPKTQ